MKSASRLSLILAAVLSLPAHSAVVNVGSLSFDDSTRIITDTATGVSYLSWDQAASLSYVQTVTATEAGGAFEDFHIASMDEAVSFFSAAGSPYVNDPNVDDEYIYQTYSVFQNGLWGNNYGLNESDQVWFLSDERSPGYEEELLFAGYIRMGSGELFFNDAAATIELTDRYADGGQYQNTPISWLLVSDTALSPVPLPVAAWLFIGGLAGLASLRRRSSAQVAS